MKYYNYELSELNMYKKYFWVVDLCTVAKVAKAFELATVNTFNNNNNNNNERIKT